MLITLTIFFSIIIFGYGLSKLGKLRKENSEITEEDIKNIVKEGTESGIIEEEEKEMIQSIFDFSETTVTEVLTPRIMVFALDMNETLGSVWEKIVEQGFSRIPVYDGTIDKVVGILHTKDLLKYDKTKDKDVKLKNLIKEALFVPITKNLDEMLKDFKRKRTHIAIIIDEYGGTEGIVTIEDLIEEILGEIQDEFDHEEELITKIGEKIFDVKGDMVVEEVNEEFGINIPLSNEYDTISGYIYDELGKMAEVSDQIRGENFILKIMEVDNKRIEKVRVIIKENEKEIVHDGKD